jgi:hypothetical protein
MKKQKPELKKVTLRDLDPKTVRVAGGESITDYGCFSCGQTNCPISCLYPCC